MNKSFLLLFITIATLMTSCDWLTGESDHSPEMYSSYFYVNPIFRGDSIVSAKDTLFARTTEIEDQFLLDSLALGDTVWFATTFYSYEQDLTSITAEWDTTRMDFNFNLTEVITMHLTEASDVEQCKLFFNPGFNRVSFPCTFTATGYGVLSTKLTVASTSEFSPTIIYLTVPIKR